MERRTDIMSPSVCRSCGHGANLAVLEFAHVPVENSRIHDNQSSAIDVLQGAFHLSVCPSCGFAQNDAFDETVVRYDEDYEASQSYSPVFVEFADRVIGELIEGYGLEGRRVLEVGCGGGDFLRQYCLRSGGTGVGFDPACGRHVGTEGTVEIRAERFTEGSGHQNADVIVCRHTLEHLADVYGFLTMLHSEFGAKEGTILYIEVPDARRIADEGAFWDLYYEHSSYFDAESLASLLRRTGWEPIVCRRDFADQYIVAHARLTSTATSPTRQSPVLDFGRVTDSIDRWRKWAVALESDGRRSAIWAASSKAVAFLSAIGKFRPVAAVDINPAKTGKFLPASGVPICSPDQLDSYRVDDVLVMNPIYTAEIRALLRERGMQPTVTELR